MEYTISVKLLQKIVNLLQEMPAKLSYEVLKEIECVAGPPQPENSQGENK